MIVVCVMLVWVIINIFNMLSLYQLTFLLMGRRDVQENTWDDAAGRDADGDGDIAGNGDADGDSDGGEGWYEVIDWDTGSRLALLLSSSLYQYECIYTMWYV